MSASDRTYFQDSWLNEDSFKSWLVPGTNNTQARCIRCRKTFELSNMGVQAVKSHAGGKGHKDKTSAVSMFLKKAIPTPASITPVQQESVVCTSATKQVTLELSVTTAEKSTAEIRWCIQSVCKGFSNNAADNCTPLFKQMFSDSEIAKSFSLGADKLRYVVNYGLAPYFHDILGKKINCAPYFVAMFDESLNNVMQENQMDLLIRYWDESTNKVRVQFWDSQYLGHSTHLDLVTKFDSSLGSLSAEKILQISMDGPSVNVKFLKVVSDNRAQAELPQVIDIGTCPLHVLHGAFQTGAEAAGWKLKKILRALFQMFHQAPARRDDYVTVTKSTKYGLFFCGIRWVENRAVAERAISIWPNIVKMCKFWARFAKSKQPQSKSYETLKTAVTDQFMIIKFEFFNFVAGMLEPFLRMYQTDSPMIPFIYLELKDLTTNLLKLFVKPAVIDGCKGGYDLVEIKMVKENMLPLDKMSMGFATENLLRDGKLKDAFDDASVKNYLKEVRLFLAKMMLKIFERSPLNSNFVRYVRIFDPKVMASYSKATNEGCMKGTVRCLIEHKYITPSFGDSVLVSFGKFQGNLLVNKDKFLAYDRNKTRLDDFYFNGDIDMRNYPEMANMVKCVLALSHGQAGVERSFSLRTGLLEDNMEADSLNARRIVKDHMLSNGLKAETIVIENKLLLSVKGARMKYEAAKVEKRSSGAALTKDTLVQTLNGEITDVKSKIRNLKKVQEELDIEFEDFVFEAEKNPAKAALLVTKATAMKRKSNEVKEDIKKLEEAEQVLQEKRKKID